jgi:hypothetical protein
MIRDSEATDTQVARVCRGSFGQPQLASIRYDSLCIKNEMKRTFPISALLIENAEAVARRVAKTASFMVDVLNSLVVGAVLLGK